MSDMVCPGSVRKISLTYVGHRCMSDILQKYYVCHVSRYIIPGSVRKVSLTYVCTRKHDRHMSTDYTVRSCVLAAYDPRISLRGHRNTLWLHVTPCKSSTSAGTERCIFRSHAQSFRCISCIARELRVHLCALTKTMLCHRLSNADGLQPSLVNSQSLPWKNPRGSK